MALAATLLELLSTSGRPLPAAQVAAELEMSVPALLELLTDLRVGGKVVVLRSASRVGYGVRPASNYAPALAIPEDEPRRDTSRSEPAGLDNTRKRLF